MFIFCKSNLVRWCTKEFLKKSIKYKSIATTKDYVVTKRTDMSMSKFKNNSVGRYAVSHTKDKIIVAELFVLWFKK